MFLVVKCADLTPLSNLYYFIIAKFIAAHQHWLKTRPMI